MAKDQFTFEIKEKGRAVLPAGLREACGFEVGVELVAVPLGPGQALLQTRAAALELLWAAPVEDQGTDAVGELLRTRAAQVEDFEARLAAPAPAPVGTDDPRAVQAFLADLGL